MARVRTFRTLISRIDDAQLSALWSLRRTYRFHYGNDYLKINAAIKERVQ